MENNDINFESLRAKLREDSFVNVVKLPERILLYDLLTNNILLQPTDLKSIMTDMNVIRYNVKLFSKCTIVNQVYNVVINNVDVDDGSTILELRDDISPEPLYIETTFIGDAFIEGKYNIMCKDGYLMFSGIYTGHKLLTTTELDTMYQVRELITTPICAVLFAKYHSYLKDKINDITDLYGEQLMPFITDDHMLSINAIFTSYIENIYQNNA